jgi:hypothetical protein
MLIVLMLSITMLRAIMLNVAMLFVLMLSITMLRAIMLNVIMLSAVAPNYQLRLSSSESRRRNKRNAEFNIRHRQWNSTSPCNTKIIL